jgi:hypothetical protein
MGPATWIPCGGTGNTESTDGRTADMSDLFDKAKNLLADHADTVDDVVDRIAGLVDDTTGGKHSERVRDGATKAKHAIAGFVGADDEKKPTKKPKPPKEPEAGSGDDAGRG